MIDVNVLVNTIRYNERTHAYSAYDEEGNWYSIPFERVQRYANRWHLTYAEATEELIKFAILDDYKKGL